MIISDEIFNRMKSMGVTDGVFLFSYNDKKQLRAEAESFAHSLLDYTPKDISLNERIYVTEGESFSVDMVNDFIEFESKKAVGVSSKILILHDVELLTEGLSDKLLKTIEDYHGDSLIILTTTALESVSRTIRSRCMIFKSFGEEDQYFVAQKKKYLNFIYKIKEEEDYLSLGDLITQMQNLGSINIVRAMFVNCKDTEWLTIARRALEGLLSGSREEQINKYLVNSAWCKIKNIRSYKNTDKED